ncbi:hypothetical protein [Paenibacillus sp.]|uniref:hypothetical protein n=1 Tax=Paenibacillus sp. TaxID=58172 RepID=UPI002D655FC0|nr:hypothetical protein [Paenibacillus sp.]HZG58697.1 hypothetical protein [Paenibacillus sp.]
MRLPAVDTGLMANHLEKHEAILAKLSLYRTLAKDETYDRIVSEQIRVMLDHVRAMLELLDPERREPVRLKPIAHRFAAALMAEWPLDFKQLLAETRATSLNMARENFLSALQMHHPNAKRVHVDMALQQVHFAERYGELMRAHGWEQHPMASPEEQRETIARFAHMLQ